jgi:hypothetical protein
VKYRMAVIRAFMDAEIEAANKLATCRMHWPWFVDVEADIKDRMLRDKAMTIERAYALSLAALSRSWH